MERSQRSALKSLLRDALHLGSGTAAAQLIVIASAPVITRLYDPTILGTFNAFISIATMLTAVSALTYPMAIVVAREHHEAAAISSISLASIAFTSLAVALVISVAGNQFTAATNLDALSGYLYFIPALMALGGCHSIADFWAARTLQFRLKARSSVIAAANTALLKIGIGFNHPNATVLILANIAGLISSLLLIWIGLKTRTTNEVPELVGQYKKVKESAIRYSDFPLYRAPQIGINNLSSALPIVILASVFGAPAAAYFGLAMTTLGAPSKLIASSVGNALYPRIANMVATNAKDALKLVKRTTLLLALIAAPPLIVLLIYAQPLFGLVFGEQWARAGVYAQLLSPMLFMYFVNKPTVAAIPSLGLQKGLLIYEILTTGLKIIVLFFGFFIFGEELVSIALFSAAGTVAYILLISWVLTKLSKRARIQEYDVKTGR